MAEILQSLSSAPASEERYVRQFFKSVFQAAPSSLHERLLKKAIGVADADAKFRSGQPTMWGSLQNLARIGFRPGGIIDIGAHVGDWARSAAEIFDCPIHMIDARPSAEPYLTKVGFPYTISLLGSEGRPGVPFHLWESGSSVLPEITGFEMQCVELPMQRLDDLQIDLPAPLLLKLDVQGYELEVLRGASQTLRRTEVILTELALLEYNQGAPLMHEVVAFMANRGFLPYDICDMTRRFEDRALFQCDMIFVEKDSPLRARKKFWPNQP